MAFEKDDRIALVDMDGTLADFVGGMKKAMGPLEAPGERWDYDNYSQDNEPVYMRERRRAIKNKPGFWRELPPYKPGFDLLKMLTLVGFQITIFTKIPMKQPQAAAEKIEWCEEHVAPVLGLVQYDMALVSDKGYTYGRALIDDWPPYIERWLLHRPRGQVIMPAHGYNLGAFENHPQVFRFGDRPQDLATARELLEEAYHREAA